MDDFLDWFGAADEGDDYFTPLDLLERPAWMKDASCREHPDVSWFPGTGDNRMRERAKRICAGCLVRDECIEYATTAPFPVQGIWGGQANPQRARRVPAYF